MAYMICWHIIIGHEIWVDDEAVPKPAVAFLLLGDRKVTAGVQLARLVNELCGKTSKWQLHQHEHWAITCKPMF